MEDEFDTSRTLQVVASGGGLMVDGSASLRDLVTQLGWKLPREAGVETLAGFLLDQLGHIPSIGEKVEFGGRSFSIVEMEGMRIARVRVDSVTPKSKAKVAAG
jgi:CBS domain containing-hemolysin-like protein